MAVWSSASATSPPWTTSCASSCAGLGSAGRARSPGRRSRTRRWRASSSAHGRTRRRARIAHHWRNARHNPVDVLRTNVLLYSVERAARFPELEDALAVAEIAVVHRLLEELREDANVAPRERIAKVVELRVLGGVPKHEAARMLGVARSTVDADHAFFQRWASVHVAHDRAEVRRALERLRADRNVREAELIARAAELALFEYLPEARLAAKLGRPVADVRRWLAFLRGYVDQGPGVTEAAS